MNRIFICYLILNILQFSQFFQYLPGKLQLPGEGKIDWMALLAALEAVGYDGVFNYEVSASLSEIKDNYDRLFAAYNNGGTF